METQVWSWSQVEKRRLRQFKNKLVVGVKDYKDRTEEWHSVYSSMSEMEQVVQGERQREMSSLLIYFAR